MMKHSYGKALRLSNGRIATKKRITLWSQQLFCPNHSVQAIGHIAINPSVRNGRAYILGTTVTVSDVAMALVPPGCFMMGITEDQIAYLIGFPGSNMAFEEFHDQQPAHEVCFDESFWIDVYEVTQVQFARMNGAAAVESYFSGDELPREQITWAEASKFCEKRGARLPSEAEWEYAARGPDGDLFPWGGIFDCRKGNFDDTTIDDSFLIDGYPDCEGYSTTAAVGSIADGASYATITKPKPRLVAMRKAYETPFRP